MIKEIKKHTIIQSVLLHLFPGIIIAIVYYTLAPLVVHQGFTNETASQFTDVFVLFPIEIGMLFFIAKRETGKYHIIPMFPWTEKSCIKDYFIFIPIMALWAIVISSVLSPFESSLRDTVFSFIPAESIIGKYEPSAIPQKIMLFTGVCGLFANGILAPIVEEFYFRGYLLPRINLSLNKAVILNALLFSLYHFYSPWEFFSRFFMMIPLYYWVAKKRNIRFSIIAHIIANIFTGLSMIVSAC